MPDSEFHEAVRAQVYRHFIATGRAPSTAELAGALAREASTVERALCALAEAQTITLRSGGIWMAHPFSAVPTAYRVETRNGCYWANCAWDALGIAAVTGEDTAAMARCPDCGANVDLSVRDGAVVDTTAVVHFVVPPLEFWKNIGFT